MNSIADGVPGFRGGFISVTAVIKRCKSMDMKTPSARTVMNCLDGMGFNFIGRSDRPWIQEDVHNKIDLYGTMPGLDITQYGSMQGYI